MNHKTKSGSSLAMWIVLAIILFLLWILTGPQPRWKRSPHLADQRQAIQNARLIGFALSEFEKEYGSFPDENTAVRMPSKEGMKWKLGDSSANDFFRQLIAGGFTDNETMFYAKAVFSRKPDNQIIPGEKAFAPGEVGFGYLTNGRVALNTQGDPSRPLICAPLAFDGKTVSDRTFDDSIYAGKAVVLRIDNSVTSLPIIKKSNLAAVGRGKSLLDTGPDTVWGDSSTPVIIPPVPKP